MSNQRKRFEFDNSFGSNSSSPKRPKLDVIQRPSTSSSVDASQQNLNEDDDLWGDDDFGNDAVEEVLLLETQACTMKLQPPIVDTKKVDIGVFRPKTATVAAVKKVVVAQKDIEPRDTFRENAFTGLNVRDRSAFNPPTSSSFNPPASAFNLSTSASKVIPSLQVEKVKSHAVGRGCPRSNSTPSFNVHQSSSTHSTKPWSEIKDLSRKIVNTSLLDDESRTTSSSAAQDDAAARSLRKEVEKLKSEAFTKAGEAALLRQKVKDVNIELEREKRQRAAMLEKSRLKHQEEVAALKKELEAAKIQLQFKELDVDKAVERCKLLEAGNLKMRPVKLQTPSAKPSCSGDFLNRSVFEESTPSKEPASKRRLTTEPPKAPEPQVKKREAHEVAIQTDKSLATFQLSSITNLYTKVSEGDMLSNLLVPYWFEMDSGANEEEFGNKSEGVAAVTELFRMTSFEGRPIERITEWCWNRMLAFLLILRQRSIDDWKLEKDRLESRKQYEEWCLDRRIPLPPEKESINEGLMDDWFPDFAEESLKDELQCLLSYRPWCPKDVMPEIRRTLALIISLLKVSPSCVPLVASHNLRKKDDKVYCYICGAVIDKKRTVESADNKSSASSKDSWNLPSCSKVTREPVSDDNFRSDLLGHCGSTLRGSAKVDGIDVTYSTCAARCSEEKNENAVNLDEKDILKFDFLHLVQQMCRVISGMRRIMPMEGTLAGVLVFLSCLCEKVVLTKRGLLLVSAVIKDIVFIRPRLRLLLHLMRLLYVIGGSPLVMQRLCVNSAWNTAYRDRWKNVWMFNNGVCPLQILITILENVTDEDIPDGVTQETWLKYRAKLGLNFVQWLDAVLSQPGHQVDWLCVLLDAECLEEIEKEKNPKLRRKDKSAKYLQKKDSFGRMKESYGDEKDIEGGKMDLGDEEEDNDETCLSQLSKSKEELEEEPIRERTRRCFCRRWIINILVNLLYGILSDFETISNPKYISDIRFKSMKTWYEKENSLAMTRLLALEQSLCLKLGIFVIRNLLRMGHPEFNTPGGEGFLWNHYTVKGNVLMNGEIVAKDYSHKNTHGGPIGGRYVLFLSKIDKQFKEKIVGFCPETEKALQELLEVENSWQPPTSDIQEDEDHEDIWNSMENIGSYTCEAYIGAL